MVIFATLIQTLLHPGYCFPRLSSAYVPPSPRASRVMPSSVLSTPPDFEEIEMEAEKKKAREQV